ncbi:MAG: response regulator [Candidatus Tectomicrobia bacterium]|uniref:Response regulator n=1 Tax=Tectimicrobiota bacterium TaxID=2528274 RepID=A0A937W116_UNCTE|nr:response regulator [Candidatus Tectomicrobia bacterium]
MPTKQVLIIDDEEHIREVAQISLEMVGGWQVLTASSGRDGLAQAAATQPDAILLDVMMPDMDGPTTLQKLQATATLCAIPVIFLTAKVQATDQRRFVDLGVRGIINKPFDPMALPSQVAAVLGWEC